MIVGNLSTHAGDEIDKWLRKHSRVTFHYTRTSCRTDWKLPRRIARRVMTPNHVSTSFTQELPVGRHIENYITHWNENAAPFTWTATANEIIGKVQILE